MANNISDEHTFCRLAGSIMFRTLLFPGNTSVYALERRLDVQEKTTNPATLLAMLQPKRCSFI
jgi:hypothetical protein